MDLNWTAEIKFLGVNLITVMMMMMVMMTIIIFIWVDVADVQSILM